MGLLLCLKLAGIRNKCVSQMVGHYCPCYITHLELTGQAPTDTATHDLAVIHRVMLICGSLFTAWPHPTSLPLGRGINPAKAWRPKATLETRLPAVAHIEPLFLPCSPAKVGPLLLNWTSKTHNLTTAAGSYRVVHFCGWTGFKTWPENAFSWVHSASVSWVTAGNMIAKHHADARCVKIVVIKLQTFNFSHRMRKLCNQCFFLLISFFFFVVRLLKILCTDQQYSFIFAGCSS